jgi:hypothetical protein
LTTLDNLRKAAKRWLKALREGDADARTRLVRAYPNAPEPATLRDVQHALARERGHASWIALKKAIAESVPAGTQLTELLAAAARGMRPPSPRFSTSIRASSTNAGCSPATRACEPRCISA